MNLESVPLNFLSLLHRFLLIGSRTHNSQETQNESDKLKRDQLSNGVVSLKAKEKDLLDFIKRNEAMDPEKTVKLKSDAKASFFAPRRL